MRWLILLYANTACFVAALAIPRDEFVLRTCATVIPASCGIAGYLYQKYRLHVGVSADVLTSMGVLAQFLLPSLYLVATPLEGSIAYAVVAYLDYFADVALAALISQTLFFIGYEVATRSIKRGETPALEVSSSSRPSHFLYMMLPVVCAVWVSRAILVQTGSYYHLLTSQFMFESPVYSILAQLSNYGIYVVAGLWVMTFSMHEPRQNRQWLRAAFGFTLLEVIWYFPSGSREPILVLGVVILFAYMFVRWTFPIKWVALGVVASLLLLSFMDFYRYAIASYASPSTISTSAIVQALDESKNRFFEEDYQTGNWLTRAVARLSDARSVAAILQDVPKTVPYLNGETYIQVPWVLIPRFLYPEKPEIILPIHTIGFFQGEGGSSPTTLIGEAYINFGWLGLFLVMPFMGWISWRYDSAFRKRIASPVWAAIYVGMAPTVARLPVQPVAIWLGIFLKAYLLASLLIVWDKALVRIQRAKDL